MAELPHAVLLQELRTRGLIAAKPAPVQLPAGNRDRRPEPSRSSWRLRLPDGREAKLTLGSGLAPWAVRRAAFAEACPAISAAPVFHEKLAGDSEAVAEVFFDGVTLDDAVRDRLLPPAQAQNALRQVRTALEATTLPSTAPERDAEWQEWQERLGALSCWSESERRLLREDVLPGLHDSLTASPPASRWTNGDFLGANLLVAADGRVCLVDMEFARRTHFFAEDAARFPALSECARLRPDLFESILPDPGLAWHLFFWLRQTGLEAENNTAEYLARVRPSRLALIRLLAEHLLGRALPGWSAPAAEVRHNLEAARWVQATDHAMRLAGWCHVPSAGALRAIAVYAPGRRLAEAPLLPRPDVQAHFGGDPSALHTGFELKVPTVENESRLTLVAITGDGAVLPFRTVRAGDLPARGPLLAGYPEWAARCDLDPAGSAKTGESVHGGAGPVKFSILLPVHNTPEVFLRECLGSVQGQHDRNWELCVVDDASELPQVQPLLAAAAASDPRIRLQRRQQNGGIAQATNDALAMASGDYVVLLDHDDVLRPHALAELARTIAGHPEVDAIYSDEDKITADSRPTVPFFKPDFSPEFLRGTMYIGHVLAVRTAIARAAGGFDSDYDGVQDYEFFLRVTERTRRILHLPCILYHWRQSPASSALHGNIKGDMDRKQADAVEAHLGRLELSRQAAPLGGHRVRLNADPARDLRVSVILAWEDDAASSNAWWRDLGDGDDLQPCEVLLAAPLSVPAGFPAPVRPAWGRGEALPAARLRHAMTQAKGAVVIVFSAPPLELSRGFLRELASVAELSDSGAVAPLLLSQEGKVLESGWTVGQGELAPVMRGFDAAGDGYNGSLVCNREVLAASGLCLALRRELAADLATSATEDLPSPLWAFDWCLRLHHRSLFNRVVATARLQTAHSWRWRDDVGAAHAAIASAEAVSRQLASTDPFFNPHFDPAAGDYRLAACRTSSARG